MKQTMSPKEASEYEFVGYDPNPTTIETIKKKKLVKSKAMRTRYLNKKIARADSGSSRKVMPLLPKDQETPSPPSMDMFMEDSENSEQADSNSVERVLRQMLPIPGRMSGDRMDAFDALPIRGDIRVDNIIRFCTKFTPLLMTDTLLTSLCNQAQT